MKTVGDEETLAAVREILRGDGPVSAGILGLLVGDACGVPYEFRSPSTLPPQAEIDMFPPPGFVRSYGHVEPGTWSDDGAQALCLLASLISCGHYHPHDFAARLLRWHDEGYMAVGARVFDIGNQTSESIRRLKRGVPVGNSGLRGERNNGNGSLMRCLPLALLHRGNDLSLVVDAHRQSRLTHGHPRSEICCALYCLWARREMEGKTDAWEAAVGQLRGFYRPQPNLAKELEENVEPDREASGNGTGYVVDCLHSARWACRAGSYPAIVRAAISLGHDTDTTAAVAGGIAGLRYGVSGIPERWRKALGAI